MPSIKELKDELKRLGVSKGLSKLTKPQLENLIKKANKPHSVNTLQDRKALLSTISKGDLLKVIRIIRITNYSHLKHDELIDLIASKYWSDFHTRWFNQAPDGLLPYKPEKALPKPSFSFPPEEKKEAPKKKQQNPKKDEVKEEQKHDTKRNKPETIYERRKRQADKEAEDLKKTERDEFYHYKNIKDGWFGPKSWGRTEKDKRCLNFLEKNQLDNNRKIQLVKDQEESGMRPPHSNKFWDKVDECVTHLEERDIWPNPGMHRDNTEKDRYFRWTAKDFLREGRYLDDEFECVKQLEKFGIDDDKTFKLWALKNHPDKVTGVENKAKAGELFTKVRGCVELLKSRRQFPIKAGGKPTGGKPTVGKPTVGKSTVGKPKLLKAPPKKPKKKPEEKKEDDIPTTFLKATQYIRNLDKSDKDLARRKIMLVLKNFKGNKEFYEKNKASIDSFTSSAFRKRMGFT
jgi:hypothetical protein